MRSEFLPTAVSSRAWDGGLGGEPSCDELRAMWRFSKRQSRATEITNEIPTYRDPFAYNMWEPYARPRSVAGGRRRGPDPYVFGQMVYSPGRPRSRDNSPERSRAYEEVAARIVGSGHPGTTVGIPRRKITSFRSSGGASPPVEHIQHYSPKAGSSFEQLRDLIRAERARELQEQRLAEEASARAASLRGLTSDSYYGKIVQEPPTHPGANYEALRYGEPGHFDGNVHLSQHKGSSLAFSDVLAPTVPQYGDRNIHLYKHRSYPDTVPVSIASVTACI
jgi:hypothetical protein